MTLNKGGKPIHIKSKSQFLIFLLVALIIFTLFPVSTLAKAPISGWEEVEQYAQQKQKEYPDIYIDSYYFQPDQGFAEYGRDLTPKEVNAWKKSIDAEIVFDTTWVDGMEMTDAQLQAYKDVHEAVFGTPEEIEAWMNDPERVKHKTPGPIPAPKDLTDEGIAAFIDEMNASQPGIDEEQTAEAAGGQTAPEEQDVSALAGSSGWSPGGHYTTPIGEYPRQKGKILVTADWFRGLLPTGHAAIVYSDKKVIEALAGGVQWGANNWYDSQVHPTCFGLDVAATNSVQEAQVAEWCKTKIGLDYSFKPFDIERTDKYYCSQLVWQGYKVNCGVDLNTDAYGGAIHPLELYDTEKTTTLYRHGTARANRWEYINNTSWYFINNQGFSLKGGWRWTDRYNGWKYFGPTGINVSSFQVSLGTMLDTGKRMDMGWRLEAGASAQIWSRTGGDNERWDLFHLYGYWYIQSRYSEMYLAIPNGHTYNCTPIIQWRYTGGDEQKWLMLKQSDGSYKFHSTLNPNYVIDVKNGSTVNGNNLQIYLNNGTPAQKWAFMDQW